MARFGVEEEFVFLDEESLVPVSMSADARGLMVGEHAGGRVMPEYLTCQIETATSPLSSLSDAAAQLHGLRSHVGEHAARHGSIAASTGTPFVSPEVVDLIPSDHYVAVAELLGEITRGHLAAGLHVHVEVQDDEERVRALNRVTPWMPALLAITGNAPFSMGRDSSFASWRSIQIRRLSTCWSPPRFHDLSDYEERVAQLIDLGVAAEASSLGWTVRLAHRYPTVEVRVFDVQLTVEDTLLPVALTRAMIASDELGDAPGVGTDAIDASLWTAARRGPDARIVDPTTGEVTPATEVVERMLERLRPALRHFGDEDLVVEGLARIRTDGTGAQRQLRAYDESGVDGLRELYRAGTAGA